jgi:hypothetical protein
VDTGSPPGNATKQESRAFLFLTESVFVMRGLDPRIHLSKKMDCRVKFTTGPAKAGPGCPAMTNGGTVPSKYETR